MIDFWNEEKLKKINKRKVVIIVLIVIVALIALSMVIVYNTSPDFREWVDVNILGKQVSQDIFLSSIT